MYFAKPHNFPFGSASLMLTHENPARQANKTSTDNVVVLNVSTSYIWAHILIPLILLSYVSIKYGQLCFFSYSFHKGYNTCDTDASPLARLERFALFVSSRLNRFVSGKICSF